MDAARRNPSDPPAAAPKGSVTPPVPSPASQSKVLRARGSWTRGPKGLPCSDMLMAISSSSSWMRSLTLMCRRPGPASVRLTPPPPNDGPAAAAAAAAA
eukprot:CAMPEP_0172178336 /NCGR_PEP_ID=MMETSP1050-20130122/15968_1 /TAXON_ID=233186 /ORGANISM="Cryptomonas curvata, Strain CCAP979/52" /LENGTH=98 /DNA_ID=CAMNT_0012851021 /DNA_START=404 /DNA_END=697 /DNA_ORIENTATION=+